MKINENSVWNKGLTKHDHESIKKYADSRTGKNNPIYSLTEKEREQKKIPTNLYEPISYTLSLGGKRIRPALLMLANNLFEGKDESIPLVTGGEKISWEGKLTYGQQKAEEPVAKTK